MKFLCGDIVIGIDENPKLSPPKHLINLFRVETHFKPNISIITKRIPSEKLKKISIKKTNLKNNALDDNDRLKNSFYFEKGPFFIEKDFFKKKVKIFYSSLRTKIYGGILYIPDLFIANYRYLIAQMMVPLDRIMLHGSALNRNSSGYVFFASDGGGKSTLINCNKNFSILNDDQIVFSCNNSKMSTVWATPFGRISDGPQNVPIRAFFFIIKDNKFRLETVTPKSLIQSIWIDNQPFLTSLPKPLKMRAIDMICNLANSAPVFKLHCSFGKIDWKRLDQFLSKK